MLNHPTLEKLYTLRLTAMGSLLYTSQSRGYDHDLSA
jgi:hypothetical protein